MLLIQQLILLEWKEWQVLLISLRFSDLHPFFFLQLKEQDYPWRTSNFGDWSGLRAEIHINENTFLPDSSQEPGVYVMCLISIQICCTLRREYFYFKNMYAINAA